ncbi:MAG TPA: SRPBCC family protein [Candidatus Dormibacteraeota bacterium]|nr:SRPBCC family protein [Candidatus Dormibacteraeota bacterium]
MNLENQFAVAVPPAQLFPLLRELERIAPCLPGAAITERVDADTYRGTVTVKVGPITVAYQGTARVIEVDAAASRLVMRCEGRETRGAGSAAATITLELTPTEAGGSAGAIHSDVAISGRVAQFGRGVMQDIADRILGEFARCVETTIAAAAAAAPVAPAAGGEAGPPPGPAPAVPPAPAPPPAAPAAVGQVGVLGLLFRVLLDRLLGRRR